MTDETAPIAWTGTRTLPAGRIANVVTWLEMRAAPHAPGLPAEPRLVHVPTPDLAWYRALYRRVGEDWLWASRLKLDDAALAAIVRDRDVEVHAVRRDGREIGLVEIDFRVEGEAEIVFFGLTAEAMGHGWGRVVMSRTLERAWRPGVARVWLHTCTHDHPSALRFYRACGFTPYAVGVEIVEDPRLTGLIPRSAAPHVPLIG